MCANRSDDPSEQYLKPFFSLFLLLLSPMVVVIVFGGDDDDGAIDLRGHRLFPDRQRVSESLVASSQT